MLGIDDILKLDEDWMMIGQETESKTKKFKKVKGDIGCILPDTAYVSCNTLDVVRDVRQKYARICSKGSHSLRPKDVAYVSATNFTKTSNFTILSGLLFLKALIRLRRQWGRNKTAFLPSLPSFQA